MDPFTYTSNPGRVVFGPGSIQKLPNELQRLNLKSPLLLSTPNHASYAENLATILSTSTTNPIAPVGIYSKATMHTPTHITDDAISYLNSLYHSSTAVAKVDSLVSIGGGSTIGLGKALSIRTNLPHICIPTTYAGSEMTPILGETQDGKKVTRSDPKILPSVVIYDVDLTMTLPPGLTATSGVNAIAHAVEALYAENQNPVTSLLALEGIKALAESLPIIVNNITNNSDDSHKDDNDNNSDLRSARSKAQYGAWLCSLCLGTSTMGLHHKLCHVLGGTFDLPHADVHTIVLPHALAYNAPAVPDEVMRKLAGAFSTGDGSDYGDGDAVVGLNHLLDRLRVKRALRDFGMREHHVDRAADIAVEGAKYPNPRRLEREKVREVIRRCWAGEEARIDL